LCATDHDVIVITIEALSTTVTNVDFDPTRMESIPLEAATTRDKAREICTSASDKAGPSEGVPTGQESLNAKEFAFSPRLFHTLIFGRHDLPLALRPVRTSASASMTAGADHPPSQNRS